MTSDRRKSQPRIIAAVICALAGAAVFQFFGNANHGYIDTNSLFWWWVYQWINPASETQHAWLVLGIAGWLFVRRVRNADAERRREKGEGRRNEEVQRAASAGLPSAECGTRNEQSATAATSPSAEVVPQREVRQPPSGIRNPVTPALAAMLGGLALHAVGFMAQQARLSILALLLFTWGVLRLGGGRRWGRAAVFPLAFMVFAIPVNVLDSVGFWLRLWVVNAGTAMAHAAGIGVVQNGTLLVAPDGRYNYDVAAACSGVRSLTALAALSLLIGYLNFRSWTRRGLVLLLCLPLVYVGNVARIIAIIFSAQAGGARWGDVAHDVMGYVVFVIVLGGVFGGVALLRRFAPEREVVDGAVTSAADDPPSDAAAGLAHSPPSAFVWPLDVWRLAFSAAIVLVTAGLEMDLLHRWSTLPPRGETGVVLTRDGRNPADLPGFIGRGWVGWPAAVTAVEREMLPPDTGYSRINYVAARDSRQVFLSIVLSGRDRTSIHRPELCLVGQGWTIVGRSRWRFEYPGNPQAAFPAAVLRVERRATGARGAVAPQLVAYWFVGGDRVVATHWQRLAYDTFNRVLRGRVDRWAYVLMQTDAGDGDAAALARMQSVLNATLPAFQKPIAAPPAR